MDVKGKVALVTGGATGLGRAFCEELLRNGAKVSICDLDSDAGENAADELGSKYGKERVLFCHCDVTDYIQFEEAFQSTIAEFDALDIVVNNAEIMNDKFWELEVDVNLVGYADRFRIDFRCAIFFFSSGPLFRLTRMVACAGSC